MQTWSDAEGKYLPALTGTYNETPDPNECRYTCKNNHTWNGSGCIADTRQALCTGRLANTSWWNGVSVITQTWNENAQKWQPSTAGTYNDTAVDNECHFKCDDNYKWNPFAEECEADSLEKVACEYLPDYASWWNATITQTWNGYDWTPTTVGTYSADNNSNGCFFHCNEHYNWNSTYRRCEAETNDNVACDNDTLPEHAQWNVFTTINQTWNGNGWAPSTAGTYNEIPSPNECRFKCKTNYTWNGEICDANTREVKCVKNEPHTTWWNDNPILTQTWSGSEWKPEETTGEYSEDEPTKEGCFYKCEEHYVRRGSSCEPETNDGVLCDNSTLPPHAQWWNGEDTLTISQEWNSAYENWYPTTTGTYKSHWTEEDNGCFFKCSEHYKWNPGTISCEPETRTANCTIPANADSSGLATITQTWNPEAGEHGLVHSDSFQKCVLSHLKWHPSLF